MLDENLVCFLRELCFEDYTQHKLGMKHVLLWFTQSIKLRYGAEHLIKWVKV